MLKRQNRIYENKDYNFIYKNGKRIAGKYIIIFIRKNTLNINRFGIVCSKKVGKAVIRNRAKRQLREIIRKNMDQLHTGYDIILICRSSIRGEAFKDIEKDFLNLMKRARLI